MILKFDHVPNPTWDIPSRIWDIILFGTLIIPNRIWDIGRVWATTDSIIILIWDNIRFDKLIKYFWR